MRKNSLEIYLRHEENSDYHDPIDALDEEMLAIREERLILLETTTKLKEKHREASSKRRKKILFFRIKMVLRDLCDLYLIKLLNLRECYMIEKKEEDEEEQQQGVRLSLMTQNLIRETKAQVKKLVRIAKMKSLPEKLHIWEL